MTPVLLAALLAGGPVFTDLAPGVVAVAQAADSAQAEKDRLKVKRLSDYDPRSEVRTAAWLAYISKDGDAAITEFLRPGGGRDAAVKRSQENVEINQAVIRDVLRSTTPDYYPELNLAATRADQGTIGEKDYFVRTGADEARARDEAQQGEHDRKVKKQAKADRDFVAWIAGNDAGEQVRVAAKRAVDDGSDFAINEFFVHGWASGADLDRDNHRMATEARETEWRRTVQRLIKAAEEAEAAQKDLTGDELARARENTIAAWKAVGGQAQIAEKGWQEAQDRAKEQAAKWREVADKARQSSTEQDWKSLAAKADSTGKNWADEQSWASAQAADWQAIADLARGKS
ncbi:hypothetical protein D5S17_15705 [Pseudonocardiaceae bacterium YIM PH 21723]|nr:hypothetical protein D5S17_15705 [Pseudonocardiaceae bacterium YIM PH 21723]